MDPIGWVVVLGVFGVAAGVLASRKGYSPFLWFLCGVVGGPLAVIVLLIMRPNEEWLRLEALRDWAKACPDCDELVRRDATVCKHCGRSIE